MVYLYLLNECAIPAFTLFLKSSLSKSANTVNKPVIALPIGVVKSIASVMQKNPTPTEVSTFKFDLITYKHWLQM